MSSFLTILLIGGLVALGFVALAPLMIKIFFSKELKDRS